MTDYTKATNFTAKDSLVSGNANKIVKGAEIDDEFDLIATAVATKSNIASPTFTGTVTGPTIVATTAFVPDASDGAALGTTSLEFSDLFLADGSIIYFGADQDTTITHVADTGLLINSTRQLQFGDSGTYIHQSADGVLDLVSDTEIEINATTIDMNGNLDLSGTLTMGSAAISEADIEQIDDLTAGTVTASKAVVVDSNKDIGSFRNITLTGELDAGSLDVSGDVDIDGTLETDALSINGTTVTSTAAELNILDGATVVVGEINALDLGSTSVGTAIASKAVILDSNKDYTGVRNFTITGELDAATLDISGNADIDGTLEADAITIDGTTLAEVIQDTVGAMVSGNTETGITVTYEDSDGTIDFAVSGSSDTTGNAATATALETARTIHGVSFDGTANIDLTEVVQDTVGAMFSSNTETGVTAAYQDSDGTIDLTLNSAIDITTSLGVGGGSSNGVQISQGAIAIKNGGTQSYIDFYCESSNAHYARLQAPAHSAFSGNITLTLPATTDTLVGKTTTDTLTNKTLSSPTVTGDLTVDTNTLKVDSSNNRVGILNASPDVTLDVGSATDAVHVPSGTTAQRPTGAAGYFRYNSTTSKFEGYTDSWGSIGGGSGTNMDTNIFAGDGSDTTFTLSNAPDDEQNLMVFVDGVFQAHDAYSVSGTTLTFSAAPANGRVITVYHSTTTVGGSNNTINTMTGDNSDTTLTLSVAPVHENNVQVYFDGVYQSKSNYSISGTTLTFSTAPPTGVLVEAITNTNTSSTTANILLDADSDTKIQVEESSDEDKIRFDTGGTERMVLDSTGLTIVDDVSIEGATPTFQLYDTSVTNNVMKFEYDETFLIDIDPNNARGNTALQVDIDNTNAFIIDSSRNVGIGSTSPAAAKFSGSATPVLQVKGATPAIAVTESDVSDAEVYMGMAGGNAYFGSTGSGTLQIGKGATSTVNAMVIDNDGHVTMPLQSSAGVTATAQSDIGSLTTLDFDTERFDQNSDFNTSTNTFTAPVTGKYLVCANVWVNNLNNAHDYHQLYVVTSNNTYYSIYDTSVLSGSAQYWTFPFSGVVDMDANDAVIFQLLPGGTGTATADLIALSYISVTLLN